MSSVSFDKCPPVGATTAQPAKAGRRRKGDKLAGDTGLKSGEIAQVRGNIFGLIDAILSDGKVRVLCRNDQTGAFETDEYEAADVKPSAPTMYYQFVVELAARTLSVTEGDLWGRFHMPIANGRDRMSFTVLAELEAKVRSLGDSNYESTWDTIEQTAAEQQAEEVDIFSQFASPESPPEVAETVSEEYQRPVPTDTACIAYETEGGVIWGLGNSAQEALKDAGDAWKEYHKRSLQSELTLSPCTQALFEQVQLLGGDLSQYRGHKWWLVGGVATFVSGDKLASCPECGEEATPPHCDCSGDPAGVSDEIRKRVTAGPDPLHPGTFAVFIDGKHQEQFFESLEQAQQAAMEHMVVLAEDESAAATQAEKTKAPKPTKQPTLCAICSDVKVNKSSPTLSDGRKACKKCQLEAPQNTPESSSAGIPELAAPDETAATMETAENHDLAEGTAGGAGEATTPETNETEAEAAQFVAKPPKTSPLSQAPGDSVPEITKAELASPEPHVLYECEHDLKYYRYMSDGVCYIWDECNDVSDGTVLFLQQDSEYSPIMQAMLHASRVRLGIREGFKIDNWKKLNWYHSKVVNVQNEIETVKTAMNRYLSLLKNDLKSLERLEEGALDFAETLLEGKDKTIHLTHGTISFTDYGQSCVLDDTEDGAKVRTTHLRALFKDKDARERFGITVEVVPKYKQDSKKIAAEELSNYKKWLEEAEAARNAMAELGGSDDGEIEIASYEPKHPGWKVKGAYRAGYIRGPKTTQTANQEDS